MISQSRTILATIRAVPGKHNKTKPMHHFQIRRSPMELANGIRATPSTTVLICRTALHPCRIKIPTSLPFLRLTHHKLLLIKASQLCRTKTSRRSLTGWANGIKRSKLAWASPCLTVHRPLQDSLTKNKMLDTLSLAMTTTIWISSFLTTLAMVLRVTRGNLMAVSKATHLDTRDPGLLSLEILAKVHGQAADFDEHHFKFTNALDKSFLFHEH